jgi:hypothetical protein
VSRPRPESDAGAPADEVTPEMVTAARKVLWESGALKSEMAGIDHRLVKDMLDAAFKVTARASRQRP